MGDPQGSYGQVVPHHSPDREPLRWSDDTSQSLIVIVDYVRTVTIRLCLADECGDKDRSQFADPAT